MVWFVGFSAGYLLWFLFGFVGCLVLSCVLALGWVVPIELMIVYLYLVCAVGSWFVGACCLFVCVVVWVCLSLVCLLWASALV